MSEHDEDNDNGSGFPQPSADPNQSTPTQTAASDSNERRFILEGDQTNSDGETEVFDYEHCRKALLNMIILDGLSPSIVNQEGFQKFVTLIQPLFTMVPLKTVQRDILKIYDREKVKTKKLLENLENRIAITADKWISNETKKEFMAITAHFIDESWILQSRILRFVNMPSPPSKETISKVLIDSLVDWHIDRKLSTITLDSFTTGDAVIDDLLDKLDLSSLLLGRRVLHMRCFAHILNSMVQDGLEIIGDGIERIRDSILYWTTTSGRLEKFEEVSRQLHISCSKNLSLDCKTRWDSTYLMLQTALNYKDVFPQLKQNDKHYTDLPTEDDWNLAKEICGRLKLFYNVTELFSGTTFPTANCYFPKVCEIRLVLSEWLASPDLIVSGMASKMMDKFEKYWDVCNVVMGIAVVLDPRYKMKLVEYYFGIIYGDEAHREIEKVRQCCYDLFCKYQSKLKSNEASNVGAPSSSSHSVINDLEEQDPLSKFDLFVHRSLINSHVKSELDCYLEEKLLPRTQYFDVLGWWKTNEVKFPTLQMIAQDILAIPVSTVVSKSAFNTNGRLLNPPRSRDHPSILEALICAQNWLWTEKEASCSTAESLHASMLCDTNENQEYDELFVDTSPS